MTGGSTRRAIQSGRVPVSEVNEPARDREGGPCPTLSTRPVTLRSSLSPKVARTDESSGSDLNIEDVVRVRNAVSWRRTCLKPKSIAGRSEYRQQLHRHVPSRPA